MYYAYILESINTGKHYIGHTQDFAIRLEKHNTGMVKSTKPYRPWIIIRLEEFGTKTEACRREYEIKSYKGGYKFKELIRRDRIEA